MKKLMFLLLFPVFSYAQADSSKFIQKISGGILLATFASSNPPELDKPFGVGANVLAKVTMVTPKTFHSVLYGFGDNTLRSLNGYLLPKKCDIYVMYSLTLHTRESYLGLGFEKTLKVTEFLKFFPFVEVGTDFMGSNSISCGVLMSFDLWERK